MNKLTIRLFPSSRICNVIAGYPVAKVNYGLILFSAAAIPVSHHEQYEGPDPPKWNSAVIHDINYTCFYCNDMLNWLLWKGSINLVLYFPINDNEFLI